MTIPPQAARRLIILGLALVAILVLTNEFHWGSAAMIIFAGVWVAQAVGELLQAHRTSRSH